MTLLERLQYYYGTNKPVNVCRICKHVQTADTKWTEVSDGLMTNVLHQQHGKVNITCPSCSDTP